MEKLGEGGQATVDLHEMDGIPVAVKKPVDDDDQHSLLLEEEALASMRHRAIPRPLSWLTMDNGIRALAMTAYPGSSLRDRLRCQQQLCTAMPTFTTLPIRLSHADTAPLSQC